MIHIDGGGYKLPKRKVSINDFKIINLTHEEWAAYLYERLEFNGLYDRSKKNCPKGGNHDFWGQSKRGLFECKKCGLQMSVTTGTIMERSHISLDKWFLLFFMIIQERESLSVIQVRDALEVSYPTAKLLFEKTKNDEISRWINFTMLFIHHHYFDKTEELKTNDEVLDIDLTAKYNEKDEPILYFREKVLKKGLLKQK